MKKNSHMQRSELIRERLKECIHNGELENEDLVKIFEYIRDILNLQTIESFRNNNINPKTGKKYSYNGIKFLKNIRTKIQNKEFIVDNY